ncbi:unnamed protein product, partial [Didymodactylos carnosus]
SELSIIEKKLRVEDFCLLRHRFTNTNEAFNPDDAINHLSDDINEKSLRSLNKENFIESFEGIIDINLYKNQLEKLFDKLNSKETDLVSWNDFCTYILQYFQEEDYVNSLRTLPFNSQPKIRHVPQNKQEVTVKILHLENPVKFVTISKVRIFY